MSSDLKIYKEVPTWDHGVWTTTIFSSRDEYVEFILSVFKEPGEYNFDETSYIFNQEARKFNEKGYYCDAPFKSADFVAYWDSEKEKNRNGVIYKSANGTWYLCREYYMWLNFLPIYDKEEKLFGFAKVRDAQYHMALYEHLAELHYRHAVVLKKRQIASSYYHMAKFINTYWFESGAVLKLGASLKDYINEKGSWKFLDEYKNFLNEHTAWYRPNEPDKVGAWQQRIKVRLNGRDTYKGLKSTITSYSFEKDATNGVGGPVTYFFHEEAGIAPKMDDTYGFMKPALKSGDIITGQFIAAGSVGDLDQCEPLKQYVLYPEENQFYAVESNLIDKEGTIGKTGLFIPEQWSMPPYIDEYGNSLVKEALEALEKRFEKAKRELEPEAYQLEVSQSPRNIEEAFASRKEARFPIHLVTKQLQRIAEKEYPVEFVDLARNAEGKIEMKESRKLPIMDFPISKKTENKEGVICIYERPIKTATWGTYYASIDPVGEGKTTTSESLCSIIVYKNSVEISKVDQSGKISNYVEPGKIVATWCGRFDDINKTHERLEMIIEYYNAWTLCENNISHFIQHMISKRKQKYLVPKDMILFLKDIGANKSVYQEYGWKNTGTLFKSHMLSYGIEFVKEETDTDFNEDGIITKVTYGVERIPDPMILKEMLAYQDGLNVDRLVAYCALVAFVKVQESNRGMSKRIEVETDKLENSQKMSKLTMRSPFRHMGGQGSSSSVMKKPRNAFRNLK
jgi:hypothetical protein